MKNKHIKFPSIEQFRRVVKNVYHKNAFVGLDKDNNPIMDRTKEKPVLTFKGTVKMHGTNASIVRKADKSIYTQSRNRVLSLDDDNHGFAKFVDDLPFNVADDMFATTTQDNPTHDIEAVLYGEWCGGSIQKGVALAELPKMFVIFGIRVISESESIDKYISMSSIIELNIFNTELLNENSIYFISQFPSFEIDIDFNDPSEAQNKMIEITNQVEAECPVGKFFGVSGVGEGVVWKCTDPAYSSSDFMFKVKGEKHSASKVKVLAPIDTEKLNSINEFVDYAVTENRLNQGIEYMNEMGIEVDIKNTGKFISWVFGDIMKEESDTLESSGLTRKDIGKEIGTKTRNWFMKYLDNNL